MICMLLFGIYKGRPPPLIVSGCRDCSADQKPKIIQEYMEDALWKQKPKTDRCRETTDSA